MTDAELAARIAGMAGNLLLEIRASGLWAGEALGHIADRQANAIILAALATLKGDDAVLSEESFDDKSRLAASRVWIVDPLDGTREYREGRDDWAVHVALAVDGVPAAGAVALPPRGIVLRSDSPPQAREARRPPRMLVSRSRPPAESARIAAGLGAELLQMGSAGAKAMAVVLGSADIYFHSGGQYEWDNCAPAAVALAAGLHVSRLDGTPLSYNNPDPYVSDLLICRQELAAQCLAEVKGFESGSRAL